MTTSEEKGKVSGPPPVDESVLKPGDEDTGDIHEIEKEEFNELQAEDPGNQGA